MGIVNMATRGEVLAVLAGRYGGETIDRALRIDRQSLPHQRTHAVRAAL